MIETAEITEEMIDQALAGDVQAIIAKGRDGQRLTPRERALVEEYGARMKIAREPVFVLQGGGVVGPLAGLKQIELAEAWGYSYRQIKNWIADGKAKNDPAPLWSPGEVPAWFERIYSPRKCPDRLSLAAQRLIQGDGAAAVAESPAVAAERIEITEDEKGLQAMLGRMREAEAAVHAKWMIALDKEPEKAAFLFSEWGKVVERLRGLEKAAPKALEEAGIYVRRSDVQRELLPIHAAVIKAMRQAIRRGRPRLRATETQGEWNTAVDELVDEACQSLCETSFAEPLELE
jgi:hypothetical protein